MGKRITTVLQDHDAVLAWLASRIQNTRGSEREFVQREFLQCVGTHVLAIEKALKPVLAHCGVSQELTAWYGAVDALKERLSDALTVQYDEERFRQALKRIVVLLDQLREQEGERLASLLTQCLTNGELELLGADVRVFLGHRADMAGEE
jgi:hypothetical protein